MSQVTAPRSAALQCSSEARHNMPCQRARSAPRTLQGTKQVVVHTCWLPRRPLRRCVDRRRKPCEGYAVPACSDRGEGHLALWGLRFLLPDCLHPPVSRRLALQHLQRADKPFQLSTVWCGSAVSWRLITTCTLMKKPVDLSNVVQLCSQLLECSEVSVIVVSECTRTRHALVDSLAHHTVHYWQRSCPSTR